MRDDPTLATLAARAAKGDQSAWDELIDRFASLVWSICRRYSLERADIDDVAQNVWLKLVERLPTIREPNALPGWLATTTQRECLRLLRANQRFERRGERLAEETATVIPPAGIIEEEIIKAEWNRALLIAFDQLPLPCRELLSLLMQEPPVPYTEVSSRLGIPVGGIGPRRARCLAKLRRCQPLAGLLGEEDDEDGPSPRTGSISDPPEGFTPTECAGLRQSAGRSCWHLGTSLRSSQRPPPRGTMSLATLTLRPSRSRR